MLLIFWILPPNDVTCDWQWLGSSIPPNVLSHVTCKRKRILLRKHASKRANHFMLLLNCWAECQFLQGDGVYILQTRTERSLPANRTFRETFRTAFQSRAASWQAEVFSSKCLSVPCNTQRQLSLPRTKGFFTGLHMNVGGTSVYKANVSSTIAFQSMALTVVSKQRWRVALNILTINGTEMKYLLAVILK